MPTHNSFSTTWQSTLTTAEVDSLLSLSGSQLQEWLLTLPPPQQVQALRAMERRCEEMDNKRAVTPTPKQAEFLGLQCEEAFYGGAAGGGKSQALLMWALEGIDTPGYAAILFRRTFPELQQPGGLIPRSHEWLTGTGARWSGDKHEWRFPSGAVIRFAHLNHENTKFGYQGGEYIRACFDELTHFTETQYTYLMSRLRRIQGFPYQPAIRAASNPGGVGHYWVKQRFVSAEALEALRNGQGGIYWKDGRAFVPARLQDNPYLDQQDYIQKLNHLDPVTRERLLNGDWSVVEEGRVRAEWFRYYTTQGEYYRLLKSDGEIALVLHLNQFERFCIVDCAGSSDEIKREAAGKPRSHTVVTTFDFHRKDGWLIVRDLRRGRWLVPEICEQIKQTFDLHKPAWIGVEDEKTGRAVLQLMRVLPMKAISHEGKGKAERFARCSNEMCCGRVFFPRETPPWSISDWRSTLESELLAQQEIPES